MSNEDTQIDLSHIENIDELTYIREHLNQDTNPETLAKLILFMKKFLEENRLELAWENKDSIHLLKKKQYIQKAFDSMESKRSQ
jgi:hypothetical protein